MLLYKRCSSMCFSPKQCYPLVQSLSSTVDLGTKNPISHIPLIKCTSAVWVSILPSLFLVTEMRTTTCLFHASPLSTSMFGECNLKPFLKCLLCLIVYYIAYIGTLGKKKYILFNFFPSTMRQHNHYYRFFFPTLFCFGHFLPVQRCFN